jgi:Fic family protein
MQRILEHILKPSIIKRLSNIERFQGQWEGFYTQKKPVLIDKLTQTIVVTSAGASTRIEGAILTDAQVQDLVAKGCKISKLSSRSEREVAGYIKCLEYVYKNYDHLHLSEHTIRTLHQIMTSELLNEQLPKKQRGIYKDIPNHVIEKNMVTGEETVWFETTPPGPQTETAMYQLLKDFKMLYENQEIPVIILIGVFIVSFLAVHPFRDGNGRLSRILTNWLLLHAGYHWCQFASHEKIIEDNKEKYYLSLRQTQISFFIEKPDYNPWLDYFLSILEIQADIVKQELKKQEPISEFNKNELTVYNIIHTNGLCGISFIEENVNMTRSGLKTLLNRLVSRGFIQKKGNGKGVKYAIMNPIH